MILQYEVGVIGLQTLARAQRSIEAGFVQHQRKLDRIVGRKSAGGARAANPASLATAVRRDDERIHREAQKRSAQHARQQQQSVESLNRQRSRALYQQHREAERLEKKKTRMIESEAKAQLRARQRFVGGTFGKVGDSVRGSLGAVGRFGAAAVGLAGGFAATNAIGERIRDTKLASQLANQAGDPSLKAGLLKESRGYKGFRSEEVLGGIGEFVTKTGDLETGRGIASDQAELSLATGADFQDLMATAGQAFNVLKKQIDDPVARITELNKIMGVLAQQGALGAVEIKDLATDFGKLGAATSKFEGGSPELLRTMGAFAQIAVQHGGAESSADASTAASRLANDMVVNRKRFDRFLGPNSLQSKTDKTKLRAPQEIMADILEKTGGDIMKTTGLFGAESGKIFSGMGAVYSAAETKKKGTGREAVMAEYNRFAGAELSNKDRAARANGRLEDPDLRLQETVKEFNAAVADQLMPTVMRLIPEFVKLLPYVEQSAKRFAQLADAFAKDPIGGVAKLIAAKLAFDIAASTVADSGKRLASSLSGAATGVENATGGAAGGGKAAAGLLGAQLGITVASAIITANVVNFEKGEADMSASGKALSELRGIVEAGKKTGSLTPEQAARARELQSTIGGNAAEAKKMGMGETILSGAISAFKYAGPVGWAASAAGLDSDKAASSILNQNKDTNVRTQEAFSGEADTLRQAAESLVKAGPALEAAARAMSGGSPNRTNSPSPVKG